MPAGKVDKRLKNFPNIINGYKQRDTYNVDESGLFYHLMPVLSLLKETVEKNSKDRLTVLLCTSINGSNKRTVVISES